MIGKSVIRCLVWMLALAVGHDLAGQEPQPNPVQLEAMKKLHFLVGEWKGEGWTEYDPRTTPDIADRRVGSDQIGWNGAAG